MRPYIDGYEQARVLVLKYLLFRFMNNDTRKYIPTWELLEQLRKAGYAKMSDQVFRSKVIGKLRDNKVIISSSTKGYRIPSSLSEVMDYVEHDAKVVIPMLSRLQHCRQLVKLNTLNQVDVLDGTDFEQLKLFFDNYPIQNDGNRR